MPSLEENMNTIIAVGSTNEAKVLAVKEVVMVSTFFSQAQVIPLSTQSRVSDQPLTLQETILGAKNRARDAFEKCVGCHYSFGIESGLMEAPETATGFLHVSVCSIHNGKRDFIGLSTGFELPPKILELLLVNKMDLTQACLQSGISQNAKIGSTDGLVGILTKGRVDRKEYSKQCVLSAILQLENSNWYVSQPHSAGLKC